MKGTPMPAKQVKTVPMVNTANAESGDYGRLRVAFDRPVALITRP